MSDGFGSDFSPEGLGPEDDKGFGEPEAGDPNWLGGVGDLGGERRETLGHEAEVEELLKGYRRELADRKAHLFKVGVRVAVLREALAFELAQKEDAKAAISAMEMTIRDTKRGRLTEARLLDGGGPRPGSEEALKADNKKGVHEEPPKPTLGSVVRSMLWGSSRRPID